ncbi:hypothetical protein ACIQNU_18075 [Streptomyces sp. NPDC091292]|uniref:hypothetical protein n=1 Tax=Streptomyces sp. NPDC091292 TaxID=3365991 RepID=UPI003824894F
MRMRSALTASVLTAGVLLGGAGAALANDGGSGLVRGTGAHAAERASFSQFAGVIDGVGPVYASHGETEREWDHLTFLGIFGWH